MAKHLPMEEAPCALSNLPVVDHPIRRAGPVQKLELGNGVIITLARVNAMTLRRWVALITGTDPQHEQKRTFLDISG